MKILCLSDTHGRLPSAATLPHADVVIFAGDCCHMGNLKQTQQFLEWFRGLPIAHKIMVAGNHDFAFQTLSSSFAETTQGALDLTGIHYLADESIWIDGVQFYGSPWQPEFCNMAFNMQRMSLGLQQAWSKIPDDIDVLITHTPPYGILDEVRDGIHAGCELLAERLPGLKKLQLHVFGHIHEAAGQLKHENQYFVNAFKPCLVEIAK